VPDDYDRFSMNKHLELTSPTAERLLKPVMRIVGFPQRCAFHVLGRVFPEQDPDKPLNVNAYMRRADVRETLRKQRREEIRTLQERQSQAPTLPEWSQRVRERVRGSSLRRLRNGCSYGIEAADAVGSTFGVSLVMGVSVMVTGVAATPLVIVTSPVSIPAIAIEGYNRGTTVVNRFKARAAATQQLR
jgi:hypothetical protein